MVYCVNDAAVMQAWAKDQGVEGSMITFLADTRCEFTSALGMCISHPGPRGALGNVRCKRFVLICEDGIVQHVEVSEAPDDPAGDNEPNGPITARTRVEHILELLSQRDSLAPMTCCPPGSHPYLAATHDATGTVVTEGDMQFYINKGTKSPTSAIILLPDIWGWNGGRIRAIADYFASTYMVVIPKILNPTFEGGTDGDAMSPTSIFNMNWIKQFPWPVQKPKIDAT